MARSTNKPAVQGASQFLDTFKYEVANELGMTNYQTADKGALTSRENGYVGGYMVRKMIQYAEQNLMNSGTLK
ncbi:MAG: small, acid-soluble spore protein, alpha/beta type [Peptococcaceae bacterium]